MGSQSSREKNNPETFLRAFSQEERVSIDRAFLGFTQSTGCCSRKGGVGDLVYIDREHFQKHLEKFLPVTLKTKLWKEMTCLLKPSQQGDLTKEQLDYTSFVAFLAKLLKGSPADKATILHRLSTTSANPNVTLDDFKQTLCEICQAYLLVAEEYFQLRKSHWNLKRLNTDDANRLMHFMQGSLKCADNDVHEYDIEAWLGLCQLASFVLTGLFSRIFKLLPDVELDAEFSPPNLIPHQLTSEKGPCQTMLSASDILFLNGHLAPELSQQWHLLYATALHGESFFMMMSRIVNRGPCLLVIKDKEGSMFGGFSSVSWAVSPKFAGTSGCFLFRLSPSYEVYLATGYNTNFMYLNEGQQTLPNGLGMGGQLNHFELWLDANFGVGKCNANCATYRTKQLSHTSEFEVAALEVWRVGPPPRDSEEEEEEAMETKKKSILDHDPSAKAVLSMIGKGVHSDGLREPDLDDT